MTEEEILRIRERFQKKLEEIRKKRESGTITPDPAPRYDDVYFQGVEWLNRQ